MFFRFCFGFYYENSLSEREKNRNFYCVCCSEWHWFVYFYTLCCSGNIPCMLFFPTILLNYLFFVKNFLLHDSMKQNNFKLYMAASNFFSFIPNVFIYSIRLKRFVFFSVRESESKWSIKTIWLLLLCLTNQPQNGSQTSDSCAFPRKFAFIDI